MDAQQIARINALAKKAKQGTLSAEEQAERDALRCAYIAAFRGDLENTLQHAYTLDENGNKQPIRKKKG